jgi:hypothetical protein
MLSASKKKGTSNRERRHQARLCHSWLLEKRNEQETKNGRYYGPFCSICSGRCAYSQRRRFADADRSGERAVEDANCRSGYAHPRTSLKKESLSPCSSQAMRQPTFLSHRATSHARRTQPSPSKQAGSPQNRGDLFLNRLFDPRALHLEKIVLIMDRQDACSFGKWFVGAWTLDTRHEERWENNPFRLAQEEENENENE